MIIELEMLHDKITLVPDFPNELKLLIEHLIISHHGKYEFGSPKLPMFPEALMLHFLDDLDSKMEAMRAHFEREPGSEWTGYNGSLGRTLLNSEKVLAKLMSPEQSTVEPTVMASVDGEPMVVKVEAGESAES
jgi:3'-5' exoribonuclease